MPEHFSSKTPSLLTMMPVVPADQFALPVMFGQGPNITGSSNIRSGNNVNNHTGIISAAGGVFSLSENVGSSLNTFELSNTTINVDRLSFSASLNSALYTGNKVQQEALQTLPCIRI